jgi:membrane associated rhomboid family serine protease
LIPSLGASGAISGVLGGYILLFPKRNIHLWILFTVISLPAFLVVGFMVCVPGSNGMGALGGEEAGGIAYAAHIGGFIAGLLLVKLFTPKKVIVRKNDDRIWIDFKIRTRY